MKNVLCMLVLFPLLSVCQDKVILNEYVFSVNQKIVDINKDDFNLLNSDNCSINKKEKIFKKLNGDINFLTLKELNYVEQIFLSSENKYKNFKEIVYNSDEVQKIESHLSQLKEIQSILDGVNNRDFKIGEIILHNKLILGYRLAINLMDELYMKFISFSKSELKQLLDSNFIPSIVLSKTNNDLEKLIKKTLNKTHEFRANGDVFSRLLWEEISANQKKRLDKNKKDIDFLINLENTFNYNLVVNKEYNKFINEEKVVIEMKDENGVFKVPCKVNGLNLSFIFDTGASDVSISLVEALFMIRHGYLKEENILGKVQYSIANGDIAEGTKILLKEVVFGGLELKNIEASISHNLEAPLLLGQTVLRKLGTYTIDENKLIFNP